MFALTEGFPEQCKSAVAIAVSADIKPLDQRPSVTVLTGLGGSAAGGDFARSIFDTHGITPFVVNRDYHIPHYVGLGDLVFCASYSGNTEETLSAYHDARKSGATIVAVTSGGQLAELAKADEVATIVIPGGQPPRTALGYMTMPVLVVAERLKLIPPQPYEAAIDAIQSMVAELGPDVPTDKNPAKRLAEAMHGKLAVIYGLGAPQGVVASRWKGQINENSKNLAFANTFPELNHNEVLGWVGAGKQGVAKWVGVLLQDGTESDKMGARSRITQSLLKDLVEFHVVKCAGESLLERMLRLAFFGDFVSLYLAALNGVDPENMDWLLQMKRDLSQIS